ncbi:conserved hypothetical protein [Theileria orientalis strain Shintoku]|uniref:Uncharacterized protein n=1 Tax=Theileria orientalis strain Shintoku TaxID=869250 RepID=J4C3R7_THEOR|nr:conserved hypothetical protein [Theileria orientalis strain Shintoku]BAM40911.1 conserved hypothetical protein [Theileria orientalis strain Shintoku]|eukprot:XP_009691212.1 conserved hypothetical protein [Theileria orientalis strain Shintoku]
MHRRNPANDTVNRGNRIAQRGQRITRSTRTQIIRPKPPPPITYKDGPSIINQLGHNVIKPAPPPVHYGAGPNLQHLTHRIVKARTHPANVPMPGAPPPPYKSKRDGTLGKKAEMPMRSVPVHINTQMSPQFRNYMNPSQQIAGKINEMGGFVTSFSSQNAGEAIGLMFRPKEPPSPMVAPAQIIYEKMMPFKSGENLVPFPKAGPPSPLPKRKPDHSKLQAKHLAIRQTVQFKQRLERLNCALDQVNKVCDRVKFAVASIFRVRVGYRLEEFEQYYLHNVERVYRYLLFLFVLNGYKESLSFGTSGQSKEDLSWETGKFLKFINEEKDVALLPKTILTTGTMNTNPSANSGANRGANEAGKNREGSTGMNNETSIDNYKAISWDSEPAVTYTFNNPPPTVGSKNKDDMVVLIRTVNLNAITSNMPTLKYLSYMYRNTNEALLNMLGHYALICTDEDYIIIISSILPSLERQQLRTFYESLAMLLDGSRCSLQLYYLERFIERFIPICFSQERSCWRPLVNSIATGVNPLKLSSKKYMNCVISLVRTVKSFCDKFVECRRTTFSVFLMSLKLLLQSSDDSRILVRGESTDLLIQIWLNPRGKEIIISCMNYDLIKILGLLSGVQSIKLNIWTYLLSSGAVANAGGAEGSENVLNVLLKNSKGDSAALLNLVSHKECTYIFNLLLYLEKNNNEMALKRRIGLYWYLMKYLRVSKSLLQYEKMSLVVRLSYKLLKHYLYHKSGGNGSGGSRLLELYKAFVKGLDKTTSLGVLFEYLLLLLINNINSSVSCLELANFKLSMVMDMLMFDYSFNSGLLNRNTKEKNYVEIGSNRYLNLTKLTSKNSMRLLSNLYSKLALNNEMGTYGGDEEYRADKKAEADGDYNDSDSGFAQEGESVLDALLNVNLLMHFINRNVDILRMLMNYLENMVYHYNSEFTSTFCVNVTSALTITTVLHYMAKREDVEARRGAGPTDAEVNTHKIKELKDCLKKSYLHKLLTLYNVSNLSVQHRLISQKFGDEKRVYVKFGVAREENESLTRFMLTQAYALALEFLYNYAFYEESARSGGSGAFGLSSLEGAESAISATEMLLKCLTDHKLLEYIDRIVNEDYGLPNYYLGHPSCTLDQGGSQSSEPGGKSDDNAGGASTTDVANVTYNFTFSHMSAAVGSYGGGAEELNCKLGSVIDTLISSMLYNELHENNDLETREAIEKHMLKLLSSAYNNGENGKVVAYELMYYVAMTSLFNGMLGSSTQFEVGRKLTISMRIFNKLMAHLSRVNGTTPQSVFNAAMRTVFRLRLRSKGEQATATNNIDSSAHGGNTVERDAAEARDDAQEAIEETAEAAIIKLVFETVMSDGFLWKSFKKYPAILTCFIKISPISGLLKFFSTFPELHLTYSMSYYNTLKSASNSGLFDLLADANYFLAVLGREVLEAIGTNSISGSESSKLTGVVNVEWFRFYFMYVQLLVRMYELKHLGSEAVNLERNFYRKFTMPLVKFEHLSEFEYLSKDVILYLLNFKQITNDNNIVCYIGSSGSKSLFVYYMKGYSLSHAPPAESSSEEEQAGDELGMFLFLLTKLSLVNDIRVLQVIAFSVFPILVHAVPNKSAFDAVYDALLNIRSRASSFTFVKYMLLTVIFNWYHRYFFTYNFFIYQYNSSRTIEAKLVEKYVDRYVSGENVEFNFNFTFVKIPLQHIHHLQSLF